MINQVRHRLLNNSERMKFDLGKIKPNFAFNKGHLKNRWMGKSLILSSFLVTHKKTYFTKLRFPCPFSLLLKEYLNTHTQKKPNS